MPIFQDDLEHAPTTSHDRAPVAIEPPPASRLRRLSEESIRTELCEGPIPDSPVRPSTPRNDEETVTSDRAELIEMLKRGASPTWIPGRHLESIMQQAQPTNPEKSQISSPESPTLLPPVQITPEKAKTSDCVDERLRDGLSIERPRSALHSGDFTSDEATDEGQRIEETCRKREERHLSPDTWLATSPPRHFTPFNFERGTQLPDSTNIFKSEPSPLSSSLSSFAYQPPTSPLVQSETNEELDFSMPLGDMHLSTSRMASARRHTLYSTHSSPFESPSPGSSFISSRAPGRRREGSLPYQAHQPRRSLTGTPNCLTQYGSSPQTPFLRSRRMSIGSDTSPLHHASMVGSYEESILRGRMSTTPSKPIEFLAQIGVLGKGKCKSSLRCPPHVTIPFPAVYYSYSNTPHGRSQTDDGPSPYVGQIDLENGLPNPEEESRSRRKAQSRYSDKKKACGDVDTMMDDQVTELERRRSSRPRRRSGSPKAPPGGSYRIPEQGQIQIILKNQNKTAVKLFLLPYDLTGMAPGTKTFIRQRSYSAGPIIDVPNLQADPMDRPILRYLVHLHICCPSKGRYYLYKSVRIVFANRVPDGKEKLRNETTWPDPRFTPYKPIRVMNPPLSTSSGPGAMLVAENAVRRRSLGLGAGTPLRPFDMDGFGMPSISMEPTQSSSFGMGNVIPVDPIPLRQDPLESDNSDTTSVTAGILSPDTSSQTSRPSTKDSAGMSVWGATQYEKLSKGDAGYGGNAFGCSANGKAPGAEGLLSQRLRGLGVKPDAEASQDE
ncbi:putative C3H8.04-like protein [Cladobotryum mycophilum]|uniref:C3H8.04-like protein n=1 Tax=Cladobotryum mycophilum TaxID=491253 RepID=A0ABR0T3U8_9HYPO